MPKICYEPKKFNEASLAMIVQANRIVEEYAAQGYDLTLRQLYYQFVSRDLLPNKQSEYKRLGSVVNDARLAGFIDWSAIVDRTRNLRSLAHWEDETDIVSSCARQFRFDKWADQKYRVEVWIEKDALVGVIDGVCSDNDVPYFSCRGYTSQSEMWSASQRMVAHSKKNNQRPVILHLGDHDPSGIDMSRDIQDRLKLFTRSHGVRPPIFERLALNMDQVEQYGPPPNPAKITDSRAAGYIAEHGDESWELDALEPAVLSGLILAWINKFRDQEKWDEAIEREEESKAALSYAAENWDKIRGMRDMGSDE